MEKDISEIYMNKKYKEMERFHKNGDSVLQYIVIFALIYAFGTPIGNIYYKQITIVYFVILFAAFYLRLVRIQISILTYCFTLILFFMITMIVNLDANLSHYVGRAFTLLICAIICSIFDEKDLCKCYINIMVTVAGTSVVIWAIFNIIPGLAWELPQMSVNVGNNQIQTYAHLFYLQYFPMSGNYADRSYAWAGAMLNRNCGMFREPGMYQIYLNIALMFLISSEDEKKIIKIILLIAAICSTVSTSGILVMILLLLSLFFSNRKKREIGQLLNRRPLMKAVLFAAAVGFVIAIVKLAPDAFGKITAGSGNHISYESRVDNTMKDLITWLQSPLIGVGITYYEKYAAGTENGITCTLACYGLPITILLFCGIVRFIRRLAENAIMRMLYFASLIVILWTQNAMFMMLIILMTMYGVKPDGKMMDKSGQQRDLQHLNF